MRNELPYSGLVYDIGTYEPDELVMETADGAVASFDNGADLPLKSLKVNIVPKQSGSGDPSPSNVRPISGWDEVEVVNDPKYGGNIEFNQLYRRSVGSSTDRGLTAVTTEVDGITTITGTSTRTGHAFGHPARLTKDHIVYACGNSSDPSKIRFSSQSFGADDGNGFIFKYARNTDNWYFTFQVQSITTMNVTMHPMVIDLTQLFGETKANEIYAMSQANAVAYFKSLFYKDYYSYNTGETTCVSAVNGDPYGHYPIPLPSTVYGGELDVVSGEGKAFGEVDLGSLDWDYSNGIFISYTTNRDLDTKERGGYVRCEQYKPVGSMSADDMPDYSIQMAGGVAVSNFWIKDTRYTSGSAFKTAVNGIKAVYEKKTPTDFNTTPTEAKSLKGFNNIWSNAGDVNVGYLPAVEKNTFPYSATKYYVGVFEPIEEEEDVTNTPLNITPIDEPINLTPIDEQIDITPIEPIDEPIDITPIEPIDEPISLIETEENNNG